MRRRTMIYSLTIAVGVLAVFVIVGASNRHKQEPSPQKKVTNRELEEDRVKNTLPDVKTSINDLQVVNAFVDSSGFVNITVFNNSEKAIQGLAVSSGSFTVIDDDVTRDNPRILIRPYGTYTLQFSASNVRAKLPLVISGVIYDDDSDDGNPDARQRMRENRAQEKAKRLSESKPRKEN